MTEFIFSLILVIAILGIVVIPMIPAHAQISDHKSGKIDCALCHSCEKPTKDNPCLKPCPRDSEDMGALEKAGPEIVILDKLQAIEDLYVPVRFNHKTHAHMSSSVEGCQMCHHFNQPNMQPESCKACHPTDIIHENIAQPGLKGAYHRQCIGCHTQWDRNTACEICHEKKSGGPLNGTATTFSDKKHYPPVQMRDLIVYETNYGEGDKVPFHHKLHADKYDRNCGDCHHQQGCEACHNQHTDKLLPMGDLSPEKMHDHCFVCHENDSCEHCHGRDSASRFDHISTGWPLISIHNQLHCRDCHLERGVITKLNNQCTSCHSQGWNIETFDHTITAVVLDEVHKEASCTDCHEDSLEISDRNVTMKTSPIKASCTNCHDSQLKYDPQKGFNG